MSTSSIENRENIAAVGEQRSSLKENLVKQARKMSNSNSGRKTLQTLQPSGKNQSLLVGADGQLRMSSGKKKGNGIYVDPPAKTSTPDRKAPVSKAVQAAVEASNAETQVEDKDTAQARAELFMYTDEFPSDYWKELAEKRREALDISLTENEELHTSLSALQEEKEQLQQERDNLREMAEKAEELAKIVQTLVDDKDEASENESEEETEVLGEKEKNKTDSDDEDEEKESE